MPILSGNPQRYDIKCIWNADLQYSFNILFAKKIFRDSHVSLVTGSDNGIVRVHQYIADNGLVVGFEKNSRNYETKGGSLQTLQSGNVTKFSSEDVLAGDTNGLFTIITNGQILNRRCLCESKIVGVVLDTDSAGNTSIVMGSIDNTLIAVTPYDILWKCRLSEMLKQDQQALQNQLSITTLHGFHVQSTSINTSYIIVADSQKRVHIFQNDKLVMSLNVPSVVTSMCTGHFIDIASTTDNSNSNTSKSPSKSQRYSYEKQIAMATQSGAIFVMANFSILPYGSISYPISEIKTLPASGSDDVDAILCCGHFDKLYIMQNRDCVSTYETTDWIHCLDLINNDGRIDFFLLVVGCVDNSVRLLRLDKNR